RGSRPERGSASPEIGGGAAIRSSSSSISAAEERERERAASCCALLVGQPARVGVVDLAGAEQRELREHEDSSGHMQLAEAVRFRLRLKLRAGSAGARRQQHELLALLSIGHAD